MNTPPPALDDKTDEGTIPSNGSKPTVLEKLIEILTSKTRFEPESVHAKEERDIAQSFSLRVRHVLTAKLVRRAITGKFYKEKKDSDLQTGTPADDALAESQTRWNLAHSTLSSILRETGTTARPVTGRGKTGAGTAKGQRKRAVPIAEVTKAFPAPTSDASEGRSIAFRAEEADTPPIMRRAPTTCMARSTGRACRLPSLIQFLYKDHAIHAPTARFCVPSAMAAAVSTAFGALPPAEYPARPAMDSAISAATRARAPAGSATPPTLTFISNLNIQSSYPKTQTRAPVL
jgi:hypothetical protein